MAGLDMGPRYASARRRARPGAGSGIGRARPSECAGRWGARIVDQPTPEPDPPRSARPSRLRSSSSGPRRSPAKRRPRWAPNARTSRRRCWRWPMRAGRPEPGWALGGRWPTEMTKWLQLATESDW